MLHKKHQKIISMFTSILIIGSLLTGCSSSQPVSKNVTLAAKQQNHQKIDAEKKANDDAVVNAKKETELKAQLVAEEEAKVQAEEKAKIESDARIVAEEKTRQETEAKKQAEVQLKAEQETVNKANNKIVEVKPDSKQSNSSALVWLSETGTKYHSINNCGRMNPANATQVTLEEAKNSYGPCSKCDPPQ